jgi:hypothetical protein
MAIELERTTPDKPRCGPPLVKTLRTTPVNYPDVDLCLLHMDFGTSPIRLRASTTSIFVTLSTELGHADILEQVTEINSDTIKQPVLVHLISGVSC